MQKHAPGHHGLCVLYLCWSVCWLQRFTAFSSCCVFVLSLKIAKLSIIPTVCVFEALINNKSYTQEVRGSVMIVMVGVGVCTVTDVDVNTAGLIAAVVAVITTSLQQIVRTPLISHGQLQSEELPLVVLEAGGLPAM